MNGLRNSIDITSHHTAWDEIYSIIVINEHVCELRGGQSSDKF